MEPTPGALRPDFSALPGLGPATPEQSRRARADLRRQIAAMERELASLFAASFPVSGRDVEWRVGAAAGGPRLLSTGELERIRDALDRRLSEARSRLASVGEAQERNRALLEDMTVRPDRYRWRIVSNEDIGEPGCRHWHSRPRMGLLGMLMGWWRVRVSSGCPLSAPARFEA